MQKKKHSSKGWNRCLFVASKIEILWSIWRTRKFKVIINFEQIIKPFLAWNIYFIFFYQWLISLFTRVLLRVTVYYYYVTYASKAATRRGLQLFFKKDSGRSVNFAKFLNTPFLTEHPRWLLLASQSESSLYSFKTSCSKQSPYLKFKWTVTSWKYSRSNIARISSLCYVADF